MMRLSYNTEYSLDKLTQLTQFTMLKMDAVKAIGIVIPLVTGLVVLIYAISMLVIKKNATIPSEDELTIPVSFASVLGFVALSIMVVQITFQVDKGDVVNLVDSLEGTSYTSVVILKDGEDINEKRDNVKYVTLDGVTSKWGK